MAKKTAAGKTSYPKSRLFPGVGLKAEQRTKYGSVLPHYVVIMHSVTEGVDVFGPFMDEDSAHAWIRRESEGEVYSRFNTGHQPGVTFSVKWLDVPCLRD